MQTKLFSIVAGVAMAAGAVSPFAPASARGEVYSYGGVDAWAQGVIEEEDSWGDTFAVSHHAFASHNPLGRPQADSVAEARAFADGNGQFGMYAVIVGRAGSDADDPSTFAGADAATFADYRVTSDTLPDGTPVTARLTLRFNGRMEMHDGSNGQLQPNDLTSYVFTFTQLWQDGEFVDVVHDGGIDFFADERYAHGEFTDDTVFTDDGAGNYTATIDTVDTIDITTTVGSLLSIQFDLMGEAYAAAPLDVSASIDFENGASFALAAADGSDARFVAVVPEPAALSVLGLAALTVLRRRRRAL